MASSDDFEVEKVLIWKTKLPDADEVRQSSTFWLMDLEWCLRFSYKDTTRNVYHRITLHQVIDGRVSLAPNATLALNKRFSILTYLKGVTDLGVSNNRRALVGKASSSTTELWFAGEKKDDIYEILPCLYDRAIVKVVCRFYDQSLSALQFVINREDINSDKSVQVSPEVHPDLQKLSSDLSDLLQNKIFPDVKLECGGQTFEAHRSVLAARSKVFRAMFQNKMLESETGSVKIQDMDAARLSDLLKFLYSGRSDDLSEDNVVDLYKIADQYDAPSLKTSCSFWMVKNLTEENCVDFLQVSSLHSDLDLKSAATTFIVDNPRVMTGASWVSFSEELPLLANEVLQAYVASIVGNGPK